MAFLGGESAATGRGMRIMRPFKWTGEDGASLAELLEAVLTGRAGTV